MAGRVTAIAVDNGKDPSGNTVYLGTSYGGLWKSTNALSANPTFTPIGDTMPTLAVGAIALDSSTSPTTIYIGTGEPNAAYDSYYGVGILKSVDGGQTWKTVSQDNAGHSFFGLTWSRILVDPVNPKIVLAAASYSGSYVVQGGTLATFGQAALIFQVQHFSFRMMLHGHSLHASDAGGADLHSESVGNGVQACGNCRRPEPKPVEHPPRVAA